LQPQGLKEGIADGSQIFARIAGYFVDDDGGVSFD
jgi:hypothetical protein